MFDSKTVTALLPALLALPQYTTAHGFVQDIVVNGKSFPGANPSNKYQNPVPAVAGWTADNQDNGFVALDAGDDVICHKSATPGQAYVDAAAGDVVSFVWNTWPDSHHGPMLDYIASCDGECTTVDKTALSFVKLDAVGLVSGSNPGTWGDDQMIANNFTWNLQLPTDLAAGNYVIRHETIALHQAQQPNGAQLYPQCVNFKVTGDGTATPSGGVAGTAIYPDPSDPGLTFNLYTDFTSYTPPGPPVWSSAAPAASQGAGGAAPASSGAASASPSASGSASASAAPASSSAAPTTMQTVVSPSSAAAVATGGSSGSSSCKSKKKLL